MPAPYPQSPAFHMYVGGRGDRHSESTEKTDALVMLPCQPAVGECKEIFIRRHRANFVGSGGMYIGAVE